MESRLLYKRVGIRDIKDPGGRFQKGGRSIL